jgi:hypothetical protein
MRIFQVLVVFIISSSSFASEAFSGRALGFNFIPANSFQCTGRDGGTSIGYDSSSLNGEAVLSISYEGNDYWFSGGQIRVNETSIGRLVTVTIEMVFDGFSDELSFIIPDVNMTGNGESVAFDSNLIESYIRSSIGGPRLVKGVIQQNSFNALSCTASAVNF